MQHTATYSPEDNKLRLYPAHRLDADDYAKVKAAGFAWAPKQELFVAPAWTPAREDLLLSMCPDGIGDEDTSLVARAEERAERFEDYSAKREQDAERAHAAVSSIADGIPMGQPILVGHHSEKHARRDAEKIRSGMTRAVNAWKTARYWEDRAAGALAHAKYKELPGVRARRIKGLEADRRKWARAKVESQHNLSLWNLCQTQEHARQVAGTTDAGRLGVTPSPTGHWTAYDVLQPDGERYAACPAWTFEQVQEVARRVYPASMARYDRWIEHLDNRLAYEKAMLNEAGASALLDKKPRPKQLPICNYRAPEGIEVPNEYRGGVERYRQVEMSAAEYAKVWDDHKGTRVVGNSHRVRITCRVGGKYERACVFITDSKTHPRPADIAPTPKMPKERPTFTPQPKPEPSKFEAMEDSLKAGVQVVSAPNLFPTPVDVAGRVAAYANLRAGDRILEPSAGTGRLLDAIEAGPHGEVVAVEVAYSLAEDLRRRYPCVEVRCSDFLSTNGDIGTFDRVVMNPPFDHGADIKHVRHALEHLRPGGRLVAIVANGPKQREAFENEAEHWEDLEAGTFAGTNVRAAIVVLVKPGDLSAYTPAEHTRALNRLAADAGIGGEA